MFLEINISNVILNRLISKFLAINFIKIFRICATMRCEWDCENKYLRKLMKKNIPSKLMKKKPAE